MSNNIRIDQIQFYVWALSRDWPSMPGGFDAENDHELLKKMAPGHKNVIQADTSTIDNMIEHELTLDARHQQYYWLWIDRAIEAIGMMEADGMDLATRGKLFAQHYYRAHERTTNQNAFISLVKPNIDIYKRQISDSNVVFEAAPNDPRQDAQEVADFNDYSAEVLNQNKFESKKEKHIHDFASYGSGIFLTDYRPDEASPDASFLEERVRDGEVIDFDEYTRFQQLIKAHVIDYIPTFEIIAHRNASGHGSERISSSMKHPYAHWVRQRRVAALKRRYPKHADRINARTSDIYRQTNPRSFVLDYNDEDQATIKTTWIRFPVTYDITIPVRLSNGDVVPKMDVRNRSAVLRVDRIEGVGIVDMHLDRFAHNKLPLCQAVNFPSNKHSRGIGMCKYGYAPQKVHQIMFNGRLRMFERMVKGGGWFFKDVIDKKEILEQQKEGTWIGIDRSQLPQDLRNRPVGDLVSENSPMQFPTIYQELEIATERYINTSMSAPPAQKGFRSGTSGRQDLALINQANEVSSGGVRNYEAVMQPLGELVHSNIVQFDGERLNIEFLTEDRAQPGNFRSVVLNKVINEKVIFNPYGGDGRFGEWKILPTKIKNNLKSLKYTTKLSTRSMLPTNPTERRLFMSDIIQKFFPLTETKRGIELLKWLVESGLGGLPGFDQRIEAIENSINEDRAFQQQIAQQQQQKEAQQMAFEQMAKKEELAQNLKRLQEISNDNVRDHIVDILELMIDAAEEDTLGFSPSDVLRRAQTLNLTR